MQMAKTQVSPTLKSLQELISEVTGGGYEAADIHPHFNFDEDLQIDMEIDFPKLVKEINRTFHTGFTAAELMAEAEDMGHLTVGHLADLIEVETELG